LGTSNIVGSKNDVTAITREVRKNNPGVFVVLLCDQQHVIVRIHLFDQELRLPIV